MMNPFAALLLVLPHIPFTAADSSHGFTFNDFKSANLSLDGLAEITAGGLLRLTNLTRQQTGHAFYPNPFVFKNSSTSPILSFSTYFVCAIVPDYRPSGGQGMTFVIGPTRGLPGSSPSIYLGLFNQSNNGNDSNHVVAVELDTLRSTEFHDINDNHVGIDINSLISKVAKSAAYYDDRTAEFKNLTLNSGKPVQVWIDYYDASQVMNVTISPLHAPKPSVPLLSLKYNLSTVINQVMYVGFTATPVFAYHYVMGWSFRINGIAPPLDLSKLPKLPRVGPKKQSKFLTLGLPMILSVALFLGLSIIAYYVRRKNKFAEVIEGWELDYMPNRFRYKDLYTATKGFREDKLLGTGGFGKVYKGVISSSKAEIAVKKVSHQSRQGMKEFVAEIVSIGRLRHRNLVPLLGYCRRKDELMLVYECMPNGSLDKFLHNHQHNKTETLNWQQRFRIIQGTASGLVYLHEEWEQVVIHRDIKASNVLLDGDLEAKLGDFGLARLYDHGSDPQTTHVVGTLGYLAPEHTRTGKATTGADVYAFGAFLLEVACGRRPVEPKACSEEAVLVDWVFSLWSKGEIVKAADSNLGSDCNQHELELVLKLGLICSHSRPEMRPRMRDVVRYLDGAVALPEVGVSAAQSIGEYGGFDDLQVSSFQSSASHSNFTGSSSITNSFTAGGR